MTKKELKQEAEELYEDWYAHKLGAISIIDVICKMAEPREKQIEIDAEQIRALQKQNGELTDRVRELQEQIEKNNKFLKAVNYDAEKVPMLEAQIEKMKCWCNCKNYISCLEECCRKNISFEKGICYNCKKWELRR